MMTLKHLRHLVLAASGLTLAFGGSHLRAEDVSGEEPVPAVESPKTEESGSEGTSASEGESAPPAEDSGAPSGGGETPAPSDESPSGEPAPAADASGSPSDEQPQPAPPAPLEDESADVKTEPTPAVSATDETPSEHASGDGQSTTDEPVSTEAKTAEVEVIRERYPSTAVKVERHVTQDGEGNYVNHGLWTQFDEKGRMMGGGEYREGQRQGKWQRWYAAGEGAMFAGPMYKDFQPPFAAEVTFQDDQLHGQWRIFDAKNRKCSEWEFANGQPHGRSVWYYPNGRIRREIAYRDGEIDGEVVDYSPEAKIVQRDKYIEGRRLSVQTDWYAPNQKRAEGWTLFAREIKKSNWDWWNGVTAITVTGKDGLNQRHGAWTWWHKNGQKNMEGQFERDAPVGKFVWWYANGQKQLEGEYEAGKQIGKFTWWHENGQKQMEGAYVQGSQAGKWTRWSADGKVVEIGEYDPEGQRIRKKKNGEPALQEESSPPDLQAVTPEPAGSRFKR